MRELAVQASTDTNTIEDRREIQKEINELLEEIDRIANNTEFNTKKLINGELAGTASEGEASAAVVTGEEVEATAIAALNFDSTDKLVFELNGTEITLDSADYGDMNDIATAIQTQLTADGNEAVTVTAEGDSLVITGADGESVEIGAASTGVLSSIGLEEGTTEPTAGEGDAVSGGAVIHIGANSGQNLTLTIASMKTDAIGGGEASEGEASAAVVTGEEVEATAIAALNFDSTDKLVFELNGTEITLDSADYGDMNDIATAIQTQLTADGNEAVTVTAEGDSLVITGADGESVEIGAASTGVLSSIGLEEGTTEPTTGEGVASGNIASLKVEDVDNADTGGVLTQTGADAAITNINTAITQVSAERSKMGAYQNRLEHTISNLNNSAENLQAAESRIRDLDMAEEIMAFTKNNILQQAATAMLAQANMAPQSVLQLLG